LVPNYTEQDSLYYWYCSCYTYNCAKCISFSIVFPFFLASSNAGQSTAASVAEVIIKEELINDAVHSVTAEQYHLIKREESIDIKHEPLRSEDEPWTSLLVSALKSNYNCYFGE
jgi:hypothetical protein